MHIEVVLPLVEVLVNLVHDKRLLLLEAKRLE